MCKQKRNLPSVKIIFNHWNSKYFNNTLDKDVCWGCGFCLPGMLQRCHIEDRYLTLNDDADNLVLLCSVCHKHQESMCSNIEGRKNFKVKLIDGALFMSLRVIEIKTKLESGFYNHLDIVKNFNY